MKVGDLVKITCKDGATSHEVGIFLGKKTEPLRIPYQYSFYIYGDILMINALDYSFEVINAGR